MENHGVPPDRISTLQCPIRSPMGHQMGPKDVPWVTRGMLKRLPMREPKQSSRKNYVMPYRLRQENAVGSSKEAKLVCSRSILRVCFCRLLGKMMPGEPTRTSGFLLAAQTCPINEKQRPKDPNRDTVSLLFPWGTKRLWPHSSGFEFRGTAIVSCCIVREQ